MEAHRKATTTRPSSAACPRLEGIAKRGRECTKGPAVTGVNRGTVTSRCRCRRPHGRITGPQGEHGEAEDAEKMDERWLGIMPNAGGCVSR